MVGADKKHDHTSTTQMSYDAIFVTDVGGAIVFLNEIGERFIGYPLHQARGLYLEEVLPLKGGTSIPNTTDLFQSIWQHCTGQKFNLMKNMA